VTTLSRYKRHAQAFVVATSKNPGLDTASERTIELINNALADNISVNDPDSWPVCSTRFFGNVAPGSRTFYFLGSKDSTSVENTLILDSSMTVSCTDSLGLESTDSSSEENAFPTDEHESSDEEESSRSEPVQTLKEAGLVNGLAQPGDALAQALQLARHIAANAPLSVQASLDAMNGVLALADAAGWEFTRAALGAIADSQDAHEGVRAFLEKRVPVWTGR